MPDCYNKLSSALPGEAIAVALNSALHESDSASSIGIRHELFQIHPAPPGVSQKWLPRSLYRAQKIPRCSLNRKFSVGAAQPESAFVPASGKDLERIFSVQQERVVNQDNTVRIANRTLQIERTKWRNTLAKCHVLVCEHLDGTWSVFYGPHRVGRYAADGSRYRSAESSLPEEGSADTGTGQITC
jgi:hypothetical protein